MSSAERAPGGPDMTASLRTVATFAVLVGLTAGASYAEDPPADAIAFLRDLPKAYALAKEEGKPLMICINSRKVDREGRLEPAARELREHTYKAPVIVELSKKFVCAFLTAESTSDDFGELRTHYQIDGLIVSPQHIFAYPDGKLIFREEFWPYGTGDGSVSALKSMMERALAKDRARRGDTTTPGPSTEEAGPGTAPGADPLGPVPTDPEARQRWIETQLQSARSPDAERARVALNALLDADTDGTILPRILELLEAEKKNPPVLVEIVRALGRPGLEAAREPVEDFLKHKDGALRGTAAVSLEYIGSPESVGALIRQASREDDEAIANHVYRALGRCGHDDHRAQRTLLKHVQASKSNFASYGPIIGLAYCEGEKSVVREVEKLVKKEGVGGGRRGGWRGGGKRALLTWCLSEIGEEKSATFIREEIMPSVGESQWSARILDFYDAAAKVLEGDASARSTVEGGVQFAIGGGGGRSGGRGGPGTPAEPRPRLDDDARKFREVRGFTPKGEFSGG